MSIPRQNIIVSRDYRTSPDECARARAWAYVFQCWHAKKGEQHDLTNDSTKKWIAGPDKKGKGNANLHGN